MDRERPVLNSLTHYSLFLMPTDSNNAAALNAVDQLISSLDSIIARYDDLTQQKPKLEADLTASQELERKTLNDESLDHESATAQLVSSRARSDVLRVRVASIAQKIDDQLKAVISAGQLAQSAGYAVWHQLHQHRIRTAHDLFNKHFKLPWGAAVSINSMMDDSTLAREVAPLKSPFEHDRSHPNAYNLARLRGLKQAFAELRPVVEAEPGLVLQAPASAPELTVVSAAA
jgi:hypothetical protein